MRAANAGTALTGLVLMATLACSTPATSVTTSIREGDCAAPPPDIQARFEQKDLGVERCPGAEAWQVLVVSSDANSWVELRSPTTSWSAEHPIVYEMPIGLFPGVSNESPLEWRSDRRGLHALLFTVTAQAREDAETRVSRVFVARFAEDGQICIVGREPTQDAARALADSEASCP